MSNIDNLRGMLKQAGVKTPRKLSKVEKKSSSPRPQTRTVSYGGGGSSGSGGSSSRKSSPVYDKNRSEQVEDVSYVGQDRKDNLIIKPPDKQNGFSGETRSDMDAARRESDISVSYGGGDSSGSVRRRPAYAAEEQKLGRQIGLTQKQIIMRQAKDKRSYITKQKYSQSKYEQWKEIEKTKQKVIKQKSSIDPTATYYYEDISGKRIYIAGRDVLRKLSDTQKQLKKAEIQSQKTWQQSLKYSPSTKFKKTKKGYNIILPYEGAENYSFYKKQLISKTFDLKTFGLNLASSLTMDDPLGISSTYYTLTGQKQKAMDIKVKSLRNIYKKSFPEVYFNMPTTYIGLAAAGGLGIKAYGGKVAGTVAAYGGAKSVLAGKAVLYGIGGLFTVSAGTDIVNDIQKGKIGEALGKSTVFGLTLASGVAGARGVPSVKTTRSYLAGAEKYAQKKGIKNLMLKLKTGKIKSQKMIIEGRTITTGDRDYFGTTRRFETIFSRGKKDIIISLKQAQERVAPKLEGLTFRYTKPYDYGAFQFPSKEFAYSEIYSRTVAGQWRKAVLPLGKNVKVLTSARIGVLKTKPYDKSTQRTISAFRKIFEKVKPNLFKSKKATQTLIPQQIKKPTQIYVPFERAVPVFPPSLTGSIASFSGGISIGIYDKVFGKRDLVFPKKSDINIPVTKFGIINYNKFKPSDVKSKPTTDFIDNVIQTTKQSDDTIFKQITKQDQTYDTGSSQSYSSTYRIPTQRYVRPKPKINNLLAIPLSGIYGRGRLYPDEKSLYGVKFKFRKTNIPNPFDVKLPKSGVNF